jgi:hypothetical protein
MNINSIIVGDEDMARVSFFVSCAESTARAVHHIPKVVGTPAQLAGPHSSARGSCSAR